MNTIIKDTPNVDDIDDVVNAIKNFDAPHEGARPDSEERTHRALAIAGSLCREPGWPKITTYPFVTMRGKIRDDGFSRWLKSFRKFANMIDSRYYYPLMAPGSWHEAEHFRRNIRLLVDLVECAGWSAYTQRPKRRRKRKGRKLPVTPKFHI